MLESKIRDFITNNFSSFCDFVVNKEQFEMELKDDEEKIFKGTNNLTEILISDLIKLSIIEKMKQGLPILNDLELVDKEFVLLNTPYNRGKQPAVDIMAYNKENHCLVLIEFKVSSSSEREAVTELSAYNQGLQNKYRGLSCLEVLWIPISTEWRITTKSAIEFEMLWQNTMAIPLKLTINNQDLAEALKSIKLELFNPTHSLKEIECRNLFSYECFEAFDYVTEEDIPDKNAFINYISGICSRQRINGFIIFHEPVDMQFPYGFTLCVYNPYKGYLHKKVSLQYINNNSEEEYYSLLGANNVINPDFQDIDFRTDRIKEFEPKDSDLDGTGLRWDAFWEKDFLSVGEFAENSENPNISFIVNKIGQMLDSCKRNNRAFGTPNFDILFNDLCDLEVDSIIYLGIHLELISKRILIEHHRGLHEYDYFSTLSSFPYLKSVFQEYNLR